MTSPALVDSVLHAIGRTPLVRLGRIVPPDSASIVVKLEYFNPTGSYKDRMALAMIEGAEARGALRPGMRVVEFTGGSTGSSLAMVCAMKGYEFHPLSSDAFSSEKLDTMRAFGADLELVPSDGRQGDARAVRSLPGPHRRTDEGSRHVLDRPVQQPRRARRLRQDRSRAGRADWQRGWVRRCRGHGRHARRCVTRTQGVGRSARIIALEPSTSPFLTTGKGGPHRVEGTAAGMWPPHPVPGSYDEARAIDEEEGRAMARRVAREEGIFAGTSSGLNLVGALNLARAKARARKGHSPCGVRDRIEYLAVPDPQQ